MRRDGLTERARPLVMKFGGTSVADAQAIRRLINIVSRKSGPRVVVVSARAGVTDRLLGVTELAATGFGAAAEAELIDVERRHYGVASVVSDPVRRSALLRRLQQTLDELNAYVRAVIDVGELTPQLSDRVVAAGELLSSQIVAAALDDAGMRGVWVDARRTVMTDEGFSSARPLVPETRARVVEELTPYLDHGYIPVVGGFVGATVTGETTTLGRGGSDYSAAIVGACLNAREIQIWTDVDGMLTADPRVVARPRPVPQLSFREAYELARFGAKVLHPATIAPAVEHNIPVRVLNSQQPGGRGTLITASVPGDTRRVIALAGKRPLTLLDVTCRGSLRSQQFVSRVADEFERHATSITTMAASDLHVSVAIEDVRRLADILEGLSTFADVEWQSDMALVCAVSGNARPDPAVFADVLTALRDVPVHMVSQPPPGLTIALLVQQTDMSRVMTKLHDRFFGEDATVAPLGYGHGV
jgi:aspartate kinase